MKVLFLYTELGDYTLACLNALKRHGVELKVVHYPINVEAPFAFGLSADENFVNISNFENYRAFALFCEKFGAEKIVCSGWVNKWYVWFCRQNPNGALTILTLDNQWSGSVKQRILCVISRLSLTKIFRYAWVPGKHQVEYAKKLGYRSDFIKTGFYSGDVEYFDSHFREHAKEKARHFPHRFLCVARYVPAKGYENLWGAFAQWKEASDNDWELWCAGTGEEFERRHIHPSIRHLGFIQKDQWSDIINTTGVFILASKFEPWGVVVHEFAAAGFPLVLSNAVGAATQFLKPSNGFSFSAGCNSQLCDIFEKISRMTDNHLVQMGEESNRLAFSITPEKWAAELVSM